MQDPEIAKTWAELGPLSRMARDFLFDDYIEETRGYEIDGLVHVSATSAPRAYLAEARWIEGVLDATGLPAAIVGAVEPTLSDRELESDLESQAISPRLRGVRVLAGLDPDSRLADRLCAWLAERRLVFDLVAPTRGREIPTPAGPSSNARGRPRARRLARGYGRRGICHLATSDLDPCREPECQLQAVRARDGDALTCL